MVIFSLTASGELAAADVQVLPYSAPEQASIEQYHIGEPPVSPAVFQAVSARESSLISARYLQSDPAPEGASDRRDQENQSQYHRDLKLRIALGLGAVYVVFLAGWLWATRVRPRRG